MNALKHRKQVSKSQRESDKNITAALEFFLYANALSLNKRHRFGKKRLTDNGNDIIDTAMHHIDEAGFERALESMKEECKKLGFEVKIQ